MEPQIKHPRFYFNRLLSRKGLSFVEVMVALSVFSIGVVGIFQSFHVSLDRLFHLNNRLYAMQILENRISLVERLFKAHRSLPPDIEQKETVSVGGKEIEFEYEMNIDTVENLIDTFEVNVSLSWKERRRLKKVTRTAYISNYFLDH